MTSTNPLSIGLEDCERNEIARRFLDALNAHPEARDRVFDLMNDHANEWRLVHESESQRPAFQSIVHIFEADPLIRIVLDSGREGHRFRQAIGAVILVKMERLGWQSTRDSYPLDGTRYFKNSKRYVRAPGGAGG